MKTLYAKNNNVFSRTWFFPLQDCMRKNLFNYSIVFFIFFFSNSNENVFGSVKTLKSNNNLNSMNKNRI